MTERAQTEEVGVTGQELVDQIQELIRQGNA